MVCALAIIQLLGLLYPSNVELTNDLARIGRTDLSLQTLIDLAYPMIPSMCVL